MKSNSLEQTKFIYWFAYYNTNSPSVRYRAKYPLNYLKDNYNVASYFVTPGYKPKEVLYFFRAYFSALLFCKPNALIVIQRINTGFIYSSLLKLLVWVRRSKTFYDLDDADYLEYPPQNIYHFLKNCSGAFVGSRELIKNLLPFNSNIILNTSPIPDPFTFKLRKNSIINIGWIGDFGGEHKEALLKYFFPALEDLHFEVNLILLGIGRKDDRDFDFIENYFRPNKNIHLVMPRNINWNNEKEIQMRISQFDIGIATLLDSEFHLSKSAFKLKQYLNNGVPVLSSNLPENSYYLTDGFNGFLCSTPEEFRQRIIDVNDMSNVAYMQLSRNARNSTNDFSLNSYCKILLARKELTL